MASDADAIFGWDSEVKALLGLPMLPTTTPLGDVYLFEGVAIGALVQTPHQGISPGENLRIFRIGRSCCSVGAHVLLESFVL